MSNHIQKCSKHKKHSFNFTIDLRKIDDELLSKLD